MWQTPTKKASQPYSGMSLIELLIAMAIGLVITTLALNYLTSNIRTRNVTAAYATLKDNGAVALYFLARYGRSAGLQTTPIYGDLNIPGGECETSNSLCTLEEENGPDRLAIRKIYPDDTQACNGEPVLQGEELLEILSYLETADYSALVCQSYSLANNDWLGSDHMRVLQTGIDDFQVLYYETDAIEPVAANAVTDWNTIQGIEVALLVNSELPAHIQPVNQTFQLLDRTPLKFNDRLARQIFQTTIAFNNAVLIDE